ncbi:hypothetical protein GRX03_14440 [Halovenus sp. WSH3]|uniref:Uncharacterized protein n=1 Tax=Halovenus carboxidivorans TaxID=2692199 RepID=A0A6B0THX4_9EURY|nr:hypothetical protein [Halovenus carboxidivorans]MXR52799.1 hypothetical protein [Halovenus carboxidivorans]
MATETGESTTGSDVETDDGLSPYMRSITVTTCSTLAGIAAGVLSLMGATGPEDATGAFFLLAAILIQFPIYSAVGIDTSDFSGKDYAYVFFMTFALWFISWGILLTAGTELPSIV